jgi:hypothetical protein
MKKSTCHKKNRKLAGVMYFLAVAAITTFAVVVTITEGNRIKAENELLSYEVW